MLELVIALMQPARKAVIVDLDWVGMRVRVRADGGDGLLADLRLGPEGEGASIGGRPRRAGTRRAILPDQRGAADSSLNAWHSGPDHRRAKRS